MTSKNEQNQIKKNKISFDYYLGGVGGFSLKKNSVGSELAVIMIAYQNNIL